MPPAKKTMDAEQIAALVDAQIEIAMSVGREVWETNRAALLMLPDGAEIVEKTINGIRAKRRDKQIASVVKTAVSEDIRPADFDDKVGVIADGLVLLSEAIDVLKWENVGSKGTTKRFKKRTATITLAPGTTISVVHTQEMKPVN